MQSSSWYKSQMDAVELQIAQEGIKFAGIKSTGNGQSKIEFDNRIDALKNLYKYWEEMYNEAKSNETGSDDNLMFLERMESGY